MRTLLKKIAYYYTMFQLISASIYCIFHFEEDITTSTIVIVFTMICIASGMYHKIQSYKTANADDYFGAFYRNVKSAFPYNNFLQLRVNDAVHYINKKRIGKALNILDKLTSKCETPQSLCTILTCMGVAYHHNEEYQKAIEYYNKAIAYDARSSFTWLTLGHLYRKLQNESKAVEAYENAVLYGSKNYDAYLSLAAIYFGRFGEAQDLGHIRKAVEYAHLASDINPKKKDPYKFLYLSYVLLDDEASAEQYKKMC